MALQASKPIALHGPHVKKPVLLFDRALLMPIISTSLQRIAIHIIGPLVKSSQGQLYILVTGRPGKTTVMKHVIWLKDGQPKCQQPYEQTARKCWGWGWWSHQFPSGVQLSSCLRKMLPYTSALTPGSHLRPGNTNLVADYLSWLPVHRQPEIPVVVL